MCLKKLYKKIDNRLKRAPIKTLSLYNNLIAGIIGGTIVYFVFITNFKIHWLSLIYIAFLYLMGLGIMKKNSKRIRSQQSKKKQTIDYHWNLLAAIMGSIFITIIFTYVQVWIRIVATIVLIFLFILVSYFRIIR